MSFSDLGDDGNNNGDEEDEEDEEAENVNRRDLLSLRRSSSSTIAPVISSPPWIWSLEVGEPKDCLCIFLVWEKKIIERGEAMQRMYILSISWRKMTVWHSSLII